jgi:hypothetical protein
VVTGQVEVLDGGAYGPDQSLDEFEGKVFIAHNGSPGASGHATFVGQNFYGLDSSLAPGIDDIHLYLTDGWVTSSYLRATSSASTQPLTTPAGLKVFNNSWAGSFGVVGTDQSVLRRADFVTTRDNVLMTCGVPNGGANVALMSHMYNGISVGRMVGEHVAGDTLSAYDGPGRMKPEIVAPGGFTSFAAPVISAAAALMIETARTDPGLIGDPDAQRTEVVKAVLLGGAEHRTGWTNNPDTAGPFRGVTDRPLDPVYGVDLLDINASHLVLTGGRRTGSPSLPPQSTITPTGWSLPAIEPGGSRFYRFTLPAEADEISILATWHRRVQLLFFNWSVADIDLVLWPIGAGGELLSLVGDEGLSHFAGGNIVSESGVDNVEHLYG